MSKPASRFQEQPGRGMNVARPTKARFDEIKKRLEDEKDRQVTQSELLDTLMDRWDATGGMIAQARDAREAGR